MPPYLYRGVNPKLYKDTGRTLVPKAIGVPFRDWSCWGGDAYWGDGSMWGETEATAINQHQRNSSKHPRSGISTTPSIEKAKQYATQNGEYEFGYIYKIDSELMEKYGVTAYVVAEFATLPKCPEDEKVILVAKDSGLLPDKIIVDILKVYAISDALDK